MSGQRILVVDDEPQILRFLEPALEASGYASLHAETGREALRLAANAAPDLVILDLGLPDMDGKEVLTSCAPSPQPRSSCCRRATARRRRSPRSTSAPTTMSRSRSRSANCWRACASRFGIARGAAATANRRGRRPDPRLREAARDARRPADQADAARIRPFRALARNAGRVVTHGQILTAVWGPAHRTMSSTCGCSSDSLRAKIERDPAEPR